MELSEILKDIKQKNGIIRHKYEANQKKALEHFAVIADAMLEPKGSRFDVGLALKGMKALVDWAYLFDNKLDFKKGILFKGHTGRGKSFLFKVFAEFVRIDQIKYYENGKNMLLAPKIVNAKQISGEYQDPTTGGYRVIEKYANMTCLVIDDIGAEQVESSNYGNKINVISEIIHKREEANMLTFGTTNLNRMDSKGGYDDRTVSRMNALFNVVSINHDKDFRKVKNDKINQKTEKDES